MKDSHELRNLTDHYIQVDILSKLAQSESAVRFTDLKDPGIENSLFMYHANKLLNRGLIQKEDPSGFSLTEEGARWINFIGIDKLSPQQSPRLLVQFIVTNERGEILLSKRMGSLKNLLNEYLLPGGLYKYGQTLEQNAQRIAANFGIQLSADSSPSVVESVQKLDDTKHHSIGYVYTVATDETLVISSDEQYEFEWWSTRDVSHQVSQFENSKALVILLERYQSGLQPYELIEL